MGILADCHEIQLGSAQGASGTLTYLGEKEIPFLIRRVFWIYDVPAQSVRGGHSFRRQEQVIVALNGSFDLVLRAGGAEKTIRMHRPDRGLYVPPAVWRGIRNPSGPAIILIFSSRPFDPDDTVPAPW